MTADWSFVVPVYARSPWYRPTGSRTVVDLDSPNVGIYCPHSPRPWLLGSFEVSDAVFEQKGTIYWHWTQNYVTGDGYQIPLKRQSPETHKQNIVDDRPYDRRAQADKLSELVDKFGPGEKAAAVVAEMERSDAASRDRVIMKCGICTLRRAFRSESVQRVVSTFWSVGLREVEFETFSRRVDRQA